VTAAHAYADALASLHDAGAVRVPPWQALVTALASIRPDGIGATIDWLVAHRAELEAAYAGGRDGKLALPVLPPAMHFQPEIGYLDRRATITPCASATCSPIWSAAARSRRSRSTPSRASSCRPATPRSSTVSASPTCWSIRGPGRWR
jgi:hypothetical protein